MSRAEHRVEQLELLASLERRVSRVDDAKQMEACGRLREALDKAVPQTFRESYIYGPQNYTGFRGPHITHEVLLPPIVERIKAGMPTDDDKRVLDSLPVDALDVMGITAFKFVEIVMKMHTLF